MKAGMRRAALADITPLSAPFVLSAWLVVATEAAWSRVVRLRRV